MIFAQAFLHRYRVAAGARTAALSIASGVVVRSAVVARLVIAVSALAVPPRLTLLKAIELTAVEAIRAYGGAEKAFEQISFGTVAALLTYRSIGVG